MLAFIQLLPVPLAWVGCYLLARELAARKQIDADWQLSVAAASVCWGAILTFIIELGSLGRLLTGPLLFVAWVAVDLALFSAVIKLIRNRGAVPRQELLQWWGRVRKIDSSQWPWDARCYLAVTVAFAAFLFAIAVTFATTNWDSLTYHLARVMHWIQQQSVDHFPTNNERQIEFGPWSSFTIMTLYLLWGGDRLTNLVQWHAMVGSLILVSFLVKALAFGAGEITASNRYRMIGFLCIFVVTLPIGLVESMNPQTDYTTAFWLCCLVCFAVALWREPGNGWYLAGAGLACGLGTLTKATMYVYAAPLIIGFGCWWLLQPLQWQFKSRLASIFCVTFLLLNAGHMMRNVSVFGSPLGSAYILSIEKNSQITLSGTAANVIRNLALHNNSGVRALTKFVNEMSLKAHKLTGRSYDDPHITYHIPGFFYLLSNFVVDDSHASALYHLMLVTCALIVATVKRDRYRIALRHSVWILASFVLFCAYLKWQQWHTRLHLAYFVMLAPIVAWVLVERLPRPGVALIASGLTFFAAYTLFRNDSRRFLDRSFALLPREMQYMSVHGTPMNEPIRELVDTIIASGCQSVGLKLRFDDPEYPIWIMLRNRGFSGTIHHVLVDNESRNIPRPNALPLLIIAAEGKPSPSLAASYPVATRFGVLTLLAAQGWDSNRARPGNLSHAK